MGFTAETVVEELAWNFKPYVDAKGITPEPSDDTVRKMNTALRDAVKKIAGEDFDPTDRIAAGRIFAKLTDDQLAAMESDNVAAIAIVTGTNPSAEQIDALPHRHKREYIRWMIKELNDPEGKATATSP